jgi:hypothetical protein
MVLWLNSECHWPGSTKANERVPKTCLGRVFNYKLGCFDGVHVFIYVDACTHIFSWKLGPGLVLLAKVCPCIARKKTLFIIMFVKCWATWGLCCKTHSGLVIYRFRSKLTCFSKLVEVTDNRKDTSLLQYLLISLKLWVRDVFSTGLWCLYYKTFYGIIDGFL